MGVYIDIDKPKECEECLFYEYDSIFEDERWSSAPKCLLDGDSDDCPLIEIPTPHGRLIDGDEVMKQLQADKREAFTKHDVWLMLSKYGAPTILEAEEDI